MPEDSGVYIETGRADAWPILVTVPHAGVQVPDAILAKMLATGESHASLLRRLLDGADPFTDRIYSWPDAAATVGTTTSRFVVDVNRSRDADGPNGVIKWNDFDFMPFYPVGYALTDADRESRLARYWDTFYAAVEQVLVSARPRLLIDAHSMSEIGPGMSPDGGSQRPAICLGVSVEKHDGKSPTAPERVIRAAAEAAEAALAERFPHWPAALRVRLDEPFDGGHIVRHFTQADHPRALPGIMVECNRALYLNETSLLPRPEGVAGCRAVVRALTQAALQALDA